MAAIQDMARYSNIKWYDGPDGEYIGARNDGWVVACDDHSTWIHDELLVENGAVEVKFEDIDPGYSHRILARFDIIDRVSAL